MTSVALLTALQTGTPTPGLGPDELVDYWPVVVRGGWFLVGFVVVTAIGWLVVEPVVSRVVRRRNRSNPTIQEAFTRYVRVLTVVVAGFVGAGVAGYGQFLATSAIVIAAGTLAVGVAAQSVIGSLVSGLVLVMDPEFNVGDEIEWEDGEGTVESIALRVTRVITPDGELVTVPNTVLTSQAITRPFGRDRYRVVDHIGIDFDDDVDTAVGHLEAAASEVEAVLETPAPSAYIDEFADDAVVVRVHYWVGNPRERDLHQVRSTFARAAKRRLDEAGVTISPASERELLGRIEVEEPG